MTARVLEEARQACPTTTKRMLAEGALLVDVREPHEVARLAFDVPNQVAMPLSEMEQRFEELPRDRDLVIACQVGARSLKATYFLMYQGFERVSNLDGGIARWAGKGFPVAGEGAASKPTASQQEGYCDAPAAAGSCCGEGAQTAAGACCDTATQPACNCA